MGGISSGVDAPQGDTRDAGILDRMKIGQRARIAITNKKRWATGWAERLEGRTGVVEEVKPVDSVGCGGVLVILDEDVPGDRPGRAPSRGQWIDPRDLVEA